MKSTEDPRKLAALRSRSPASARAGRAGGPGHAGTGLAAGAEPQHARLGALQTRVAELAALDPGAAAAALPASAAVDPQVSVPAQHPAGGDPHGPVLVQHQQPVREVDEPAQITRAPGRRGGVDAAQEAQFAAVDVADPGEVALVEQGEADLSLRLGGEVLHRA